MFTKLTANTGLHRKYIKNETVEEAKNIIPSRIIDEKKKRQNLVKRNQYSL